MHRVELLRRVNGREAGVCDLVDMLVSAILAGNLCSIFSIFLKFRLLAVLLHSFGWFCCDGSLGM